MSAYYNENDPFAAGWLRGLIARRLIADGMVDERSIVDVQAADLQGFAQCHFFAGIGGWSLALRMGGVADDERVWTGSCPCQSISGAGLRRGHADERHLWPAFYRLIAECAPAIVFGEQVGGRDGREWLSGVRADLEGLGYAVGGADLCAAGVGAPHIRQRLYWVADANRERRERKWLRIRRPSREDIETSRRREDDQRLGDAEGAGSQGQRGVDRAGDKGDCGLALPAMQAGVAGWNGATRLVDCADGARRIAAEPALFPLADGLPGRVGLLRGAGNAIVPHVAASFIRAAFDAMGDVATARLLREVEAARLLSRKPRVERGKEAG